MVFTACFTLPLIGLAVFQCNPIKAVWDLEAAKTAKCVDWITVLRLTVVYEVIAEVVIFSLPVPIVLKLQMKTAKKVQLCIFFGLGVVVIGVSIARVPFLKGVIDRSDQTYTVTGTAILGFAASAVGHITAAVPTVRALIRFVMNGFKHNTQASSSSDQENSYESRTKRSYKSLEHSKNITNYSGDTLGASTGRSKASCDASDPYMLSAIHGQEGADTFVELRPVETFVTKHTQPGGLQSHPSGHGTVSEISGPVLADSASDEAILTRDYFK
ncbi:hypothetical protein G6514_004960 [Epicoccum nigrum]|nr:hypothetical protein G6514_004960 [Epicoccum nigrum]